MKKTLCFLIFCFLITSCAVQKPLYSWNKYEISTYNYIKNSDEKSVQQLIEDYQKIIDNQKGTRNTVPPGVYADYGFLLIQSGRVSDGKALLEKEIALYPESKVFIDRILKMMEK